MFGLPIETFLILSIIPAGWVVYTAVFWFLSKNWPEEQ